MKVFTEEIPFALVSQVRTIELTAVILAISIFMSNEGASRVLKEIGIKVSNDTIKRIYDRIIIEDNPDVEGVGIDDVATRKGRVYATAIYDLEDHHLIALLKGRDAETLKVWLKDHKKINMVARDRASAYAKAIDEALTECIQVADRYHLLDNLIERMSDIFKEKIPSEIFIRDGEIKDNAPKKVTSIVVSTDKEILEQFNYDNEIPVDEKGESVGYDNKKRNLSGSQYMNMAKNREKKQELIREIQNQYGEDIKSISKIYGISVDTAKKYKNMTEEEIAALSQPKDYKKRKTVIDEYINIIYKMLKDKIDPKDIFSYVIKCGYSGSVTTLEEYIRILAKNNFDRKVPLFFATEQRYPEDVTVIKSEEILRNITTKDAKIKKNEDVEKNIGAIKDKYTTVTDMENAYNDFYETLMGCESNELDNFIKKYENSDINGFVEGIKMDIEPVKNAISYDVNSGFVEGNNNKFKLIKRILYGRAKLVNLFKKCYFAFQKNIDSMKLKQLILNQTIQT